ncbi:hypothetical protein GE09DRAFT_1103449 [Coniochaeta sp. 2T2.1]|nr:hypothetical protein GE09DRAFT_1103449 [Coniochaeta sp. 2T2.1]
MTDPQSPYFIPIRTRMPADINSLSSADSTYGSVEAGTPSATHDISRVSYHVKHLDSFVQAVQDSADRAFPNQSRSAQRYSKVQTLLLHWATDDLWVVPELEDLEKCLRDDYNYETEVFPIPSDNAQLALTVKVADMITKHDSEDTLFIVYYAGHARIDESRQSTWCATRRMGSPTLQWSAIQILLERSISDCLILLDCCAGAASATFATGRSITETISASAWDAIAPDPGRYSFTNVLIEVLIEWSHRAFSAAMLHAEILARLKHPRPILINGRRFEARSTPVHFMMTSDHKAASIEFSRLIPQTMRLAAPPREPSTPFRIPGTDLVRANEPNEDNPHVLISLQLEDDQQLDLDAWEQWLAAFPALARHCKVQGLFKSHSTTLLLSLPVMVWDLLPDDPACSFVTFIRSNNLLLSKSGGEQAVATAPITTMEATTVCVAPTRYPAAEPTVIMDDNQSSYTGTTLVKEHEEHVRHFPVSRTTRDVRPTATGNSQTHAPSPLRPTPTPPTTSLESGLIGPPLPSSASASTVGSLARAHTTPVGVDTAGGGEMMQQGIARTMIHSHTRSSRRRVYGAEEEIPKTPRLAKHVIERLEDYFQKEPMPDSSVTDFLASNLGIETHDVDVWFHYRRQQQMTNNNLQNLKINDLSPETKDGARMILPGDLQQLLDIFPTKQVLVVDLRAPSAFEKSHIHEAINLRAPVSFIENTSLEMIQDTFTDDQSRRTFAQWSHARCVVFYDRVVEFGWECPVADAVYDKFRRKGWAGECFVLKGHYHEFLSSFDKYISGHKMTQRAKEYLDGLRQRQSASEPEARDAGERYGEWLRERDNSDRAAPTELIPSKKAERVRAVDEHQRELEAELEMRFPALYKKALALRPMRTPTYRTVDPAPSYTRRKEKQAEEESFDPGMVEPFVRGMEKMREAVAAAAAAGTAEGGLDARGKNNNGLSASPPGTPLPKYNKAAGPGPEAPPPPVDKFGDPLGTPTSLDDFDDFENDESLRSDPGFQRAGVGATTANSNKGEADEGSNRKARTQASFWRFRIKPGSK